MRYAQKITFSIVGTIVVGLAAVSAGYYSKTSRLLKDGLVSSLTAKAVHSMETLDRFILDDIHDINVAATSNVFTSEPLNIKDVARRLQEFRDGWQTYSSFSFYDMAGQKLIDTSGLFIGRIEKDQTFFKEAIKNGRSMGSEPASSATLGEPTLYFSNIVKGAKGTPTGVVVGRLPISKLQDVVSEGGLFPLDIIDQNHRIIFSSRDTTSGSNEFGAPFPDKQILNELRSGKRSGFTDAHHHEGIGTHYDTFATGNGWTIVLWIPESHISVPLGELQKNVATTFVFAVTLSLLLSAYLGRQLSKPLKKISDAARDVGRGNLDIQIDYPNQDEFGELATTFTTTARNLKAAKDRLERSSHDLENKVRERTAQLEEAVTKSKDLQEITLSILEDTNEAKLELSKSNTALKKAQHDISEFARNLEERVNERTRELAVLYDISNAVSYTNDYQGLSQLIMESLSKIVEYDICALLFFDATEAILGMKIMYAPVEKFADDIRQTLISSVETLTGESIHDKKLISKLIAPTSTDAPKDRDFTKIKSVLDLPLVIGKKTIGAIILSSCKNNAFSEENARLIRTIINQISGTIARLQSTFVAEKSKMESMIESMSEGIIMTDERDEIAISNPRATEIMGPAGNLLDQMQSLGLFDLLQECKATNEPVTKDIAMSASGRNTFIRCDVAPVKKPTGDIIGHVTILRDITKERDLDNIKSKFVSTVSHELRTPLSITKEGISLILDRTVGALNERQEYFLTAARNNIDLLTNIINDLLDIAKLDAGKMEFTTSPTDFSELIRQVVDSFQISAKRRGIEIRTKLPIGKTVIHVDSEKMTQVFVNLIGNSMKFTEKGSIEVVVKDHGDEVECIVEDTGVGISRDDLTKLFKKFQQFNRVEGSERGTGLGLSIVKGIIELHRGKIWAESEIGKGTKFHIIVPK